MFPSHDPDSTESFLVSVLESFDFGLCRIGLIEDNVFKTPSVFKTEEYSHDERNHTITLCRAQDWKSLERTMLDHYPRLKEKYKERDGWYFSLGQPIHHRKGVNYV